MFASATCKQKQTTVQTQSKQGMRNRYAFMEHYRFKATVF